MTARVRTRAEQKDATRARLLKVARRAFAEHGHDQASVGAICRTARVTHGALYHHFSSKDELFAAVVAELFHDIGARVLAAERSREGWDSVAAACDAYLDACTDADVQAIVFRDGPRVLRSFDDVDRAANAPLVTTLLAGWMERGLLRPRPVEALARMLGAAFAEAGALVTEAADPVHARAQAGALLADWLHALRRAPGEAPRVLATDRLTLEPWSTADVPALLALFAKEDVRCRGPEGEALDAAWMGGAVRASDERFARGELGMFVARTGQRALVGVAGVAKIHGEVEELVVVVDPALSRQRYGGEMASAVVREASARGVPSLRASAEEANTAAVRLLERLGFVRWSRRGAVVAYVRAGRDPAG